MIISADQSAKGSGEKVIVFKQSQKKQRNQDPQNHKRLLFFWVFADKETQKKSKQGKKKKA